MVVQNQICLLYFYVVTFKKYFVLFGIKLKRIGFNKLSLSRSLIELIESITTLLNSLFNIIAFGRPRWKQLTLSLSTTFWLFQWHYFLGADWVCIIGFTLITLVNGYFVLIFGRFAPSFFVSRLLHCIILSYICVLTLCVRLVAEAYYVGLVLNQLFINRKLQKP